MKSPFEHGCEHENTPVNISNLSFGDRFIFADDPQKRQFEYHGCRPGSFGTVCGYAPVEGHPSPEGSTKRETGVYEIRELFGVLEISGTSQVIQIMK